MAIQLLSEMAMQPYVPKETRPLQQRYTWQMIPTSATQDSRRAPRITSWPVLQASVVWGTIGRNSWPGATVIEIQMNIPRLRGLGIQGSASGFGGSHPAAKHVAAVGCVKSRRHVAG